MAASLEAVILLVVASLVTQQVVAKTCETEDYEDGICIPLQKCDLFKEKINKAGLSEGERNLVRKEQEKCGDEEHKLICCKRKPRAKIPKSYEDVKPLVEEQHAILPDQTICGLDSGDRIFYGNITNLDQYPWLILVKYIDDGIVKLF